MRMLYFMVFFLPAQLLRSYSTLLLAELSGIKALPTVKNLSMITSY